MIFQAYETFLPGTVFWMIELLLGLQAFVLLVFV